MQLYALDLSGEIIFSKHAQKKCNYTCVECGGILRLREGEQRQHHFYHLTYSQSCHLHAKSAAHLQTQLYLERCIPQGEVFLEYRFPTIQRIADVVWLPKKLIFEVQCSPLTTQELLSRQEDYGLCGYKVIWILHDKRYNQWRVSPIENKLGSSLRYFTNIDAEGKGFIYDQWEHIERGIRKSVLPPLPVDISNPFLDGFKGDLESLEQDHPYLAKVFEKKSALQSSRKGFSLEGFLQKTKKIASELLTYFLRPYCD